VIEFTSICGETSRAGTGRYRWRIQGRKLRLEPIGRDECSGRSVVLADAAYERRG
jgi:hypothetical protein